MMFRNKMRIAGAITIIGILGIVGHLSARENVVTAHHRSMLRTTAAACQPATAAIDMQINNVRARLMTGGDMWWNIGEQVAEYEIPVGSGKSSQFAASCWIGGKDEQGQLKVAAQTYRQDGNDYWPGALDANGKISSDTCQLWDRFWQVDGATINSFISLYKSGATIPTTGIYAVIYQWPGAGNKGAKGADQKTNLSLNSNFTYAAFKDLNGNGIYEPAKGEYPVLESNGVQSVPDELIWWVFNDAGNVKQQSLTAAIGVEVQTSAFAYATQDFLNNSTFCNYRVINRGSLTIDSTYLAVWDDCDLGYYLDDYIGCDTSRGLGIQYNGTNDDGQSGGHPVNSYGPNPPQVGLDFFQGPKRPIHRAGLPDTTQQLRMTNFTYYNNDASVIGNPDNGVQIYFYMTGSIRNGQRFSDDFQGCGVPTTGYGSGPVSNFVFWGDPGDCSQWSECACNNNPGDRRFIFSSGPFQLLPGAINDITFGCVWAPQPAGGCPSTNFKTIRSIDDQAQALFDNNFKTVEGPEAPRVVIRQLDRRLVFYLVNDFGSNNYGENYGNDKGSYKDSLQYHQAVVKALKISNDTLYRFQGYRVFQLANSQVSTDQIFDPNTGEIDATKAAEVFECDVHDSVKQIVNYVKNINISDTTNIPQIKVNGKDSGIVHSFELTTDKFATGVDNQFVNYQSYYFVAIAYAYNNFSSFDPRNSGSTQDVPYLASGHSSGLNPLVIYSAMPNPSNGALGTVINADYGSGVTVTRVEGVGNGGNIVELDTASENTALLNGTVGLASYQNSQGPIDVKVVDPVNVPAYNWILQVTGPAGADSGVTAAGGWRLTALDGSTVKETIYSEQSINNVNEQIIERYGISVTIKQQLKPGIDQVDGDGYITSSIVFDDPSQPWLWGVKDQTDSSFANWLRSGNNQAYKQAPNASTNPCNFNDYNKRDTLAAYENMLANFSPAQSSWGPYALAAAYNGSGMHAGSGTQCGFEVAYSSVTQSALGNFTPLPDVDVVFTSDRSKWTRCVVIEEQEDTLLAQGRAPKFSIRRHAGWDGVASGNTPVYSESATDAGMSWFPGYAIDQSTGNRLNIIFGEDSYLTSDNGGDMIWNPSSNEFSTYDGSVLFGGKHIIYILGSKYDKDSAFILLEKTSSATNTNLRTAFTAVQWVGVPLLNPNTPLLSLENGIIPNKARIQLRVTRPYAAYQAVTPAPTSPVALDSANSYNPYYTFSTVGLAPTALSDTSNRNLLLSHIYAVPNPYYGYSGYEANRFDTKVRIINLPAQVTINIFALDGSLIRTLTKNDPNTSYLDWDIKNTAGLPIASGMYLMDVKAAGIGEVVVKWFGATRPIDVTTY